MVGTMATSPAPETPYASDFSVILHYDPMMVAELAMGADHPHEIAERYGVDTVDYEHLAAQEWFARLVAQKRTEFHDQGVLFTAKAGMMAEALLTRLFQQSMAAVLPPPLMVEVAKQLTDIGRLKPQPLNTQPGQGGGAFQINIMVNDKDVVAASHLVHSPVLANIPASPGGAVAPASTLVPTGAGAADALAPGQTTPLSPTHMSLDFTPPKGKPPASISNLRVPDFDLRQNPNASAFGAAAAPPGVGLPSTR